MAIPIWCGAEFVAVLIHWVESRWPWPPCGKDRSPHHLPWASMHLMVRRSPVDSCGVVIVIHNLVAVSAEPPQRLPIPVLTFQDANFLLGIDRGQQIEAQVPPKCSKAQGA